MNNKLFVGGLSWNTTEDSLRDFFAQAGEVLEVKIIIDHKTGKSKGFGFVTMKTPEDAERALKELDGQELDGRKIGVNEAREQQPR